MKLSKSCELLHCDYIWFIQYITFCFLENVTEDMSIEAQKDEVLTWLHFCQNLPLLHLSHFNGLAKSEQANPSSEGSARVVVEAPIGRSRGRERGMVDRHARQRGAGMPGRARPHAPSFDSLCQAGHAGIGMPPLLPVPACAAAAWCRMPSSERPVAKPPCAPQGPAWQASVNNSYLHGLQIWKLFWWDKWNEFDSVLDYF